MKKRRVSAPETVAPDRSLARISALAVLVSMSSFFFYLQRGGILMHGDAVAHINIARRVFDSLTPGPLQLGTVWLPLPHLLMIPFLWSNGMWQSGAGGSFPSMIAYVFGVVGIFRLVCLCLEFDPRTKPAARVAAGVATLAYGANPNLIYMQTTALTEPLYLALFIWALVFFAQFLTELLRGGSESIATRRALTQCAYCLACAELTRYDGWFLAVLMGALVAAWTIVRWQDVAFRTMALKFLLGIATVPVLWLVYNAVVYGNALEFANGPYSAKAIQLRVGAPNPAFHNIWVAALYFLKSGQIILAPGGWGRLWLVAALLSTFVALWKLPRQALVILAFLWTPLVFYSLSIAYGSVPLHVPMWWPFAIFNERYGLQLLPLFSVSVGLSVALVSSWLLRSRVWRVAPVALALIVVSYFFVWGAQPVCWQEASRNWESRRSLDTAVEQVIQGLPPDSKFLMDTGEHVGVMERLGIPLRRVVNGENHRAWKRPTDPEGIWERALADPGRYVNYVIAFEGDSVDQGVNRSNLTLLTEIHALGRPPAKIYSARSR